MVLFDLLLMARICSMPVAMEAAVRRGDDGKRQSGPALLMARNKAGAPGSPRDVARRAGAGTP